MIMTTMIKVKVSAAVRQGSDRRDLLC